MATLKTWILVFGLGLVYVTLSESTLCKDRGKYCQKWSGYGYCNKSYLRSSMKINCQQSCGYCATITVATATATTTTRPKTSASWCFDKVKYCSLVKKWGNCNKK